MSVARIPPRADPTEAPAADVGRGPVEQRDHQGHQEQQNRPLGGVPHQDGRVAEPDRRARALGQRTGEHHDQRARREHQHQHQGQGDAQRCQLPHGPALRQVVHRVGGADERGHVAGGRPRRRHQADDRQHTAGAAAAAQLDDRVPQNVPRGALRQVTDVVEQPVRHARPGHSQQRHQHQQRGEQRQHAVVGERRRPVGEFVVPELLDRTPYHRPPRTPGQAAGPVRPVAGPRPRPRPRRLVLRSFLVHDQPGFPDRDRESSP